MARTPKPERHEAKRQMLTFKAGQRHLKTLLRMQRFITVPGVPEKQTIGTWARHLRDCHESHHARIALQATLRVREADSPQ